MQRRTLHRKPRVHFAGPCEISQGLTKPHRGSQTWKPPLAFRNPLRNFAGGLRNWPAMQLLDDPPSKLQFFVFLSIVKAQWHLATCPWCLGTINRTLKTCLGIFWSFDQFLGLKVRKFRFSLLSNFLFSLSSQTSFGDDSSEDERLNPSFLGVREARWRNRRQRWDF